MRLMPLLTAIVVAGALYFLIIDRARLMDFIASISPDGQTDEVQTVAPAENTVPDAMSQPAEPEAALVRVVVRRSHEQQIDSAVILRGRTEASREVEVRAETSGLVRSEPLRKGSFVEAGEILCELDPGTRQSSLDEALARLSEAQARLPEARSRVPAAEAALAEARSRVGEGEARLAEARARLTEAEINRNAARQLSAGGFASDTRVANADAAYQSALAGVTSAEAALQGIASQIISAEAAIEGAQAGVEGALAAIQSAEAAVASARREIARLTIRAPFAGLLETDTAELGSLLQAGSPCATVIQIDPIKLVGFVAELDVAKIRPGALAGAQLTSGQQVQGQVSFVSRSADDTTRTFRVEVEVPNADMSINDGETAQILVQTPGRAAHLLPQSALTLGDDGTLGVRVLTEGNIVDFVPVEMIRDTPRGVQVAGLDPVADVIVVGQEYVIEGVEVIPTWQEVDG